MSNNTALPASLLAAVESAFNAYLGLDAENAARLARLQGKVIGLELRGLERHFYLLPQHDSVIVLGTYEGEADAVISGSPIALMAMHHPENRSRSLFSGAVEIRGEVGVGQALQAILDDMDIDWEEMLSHYTGDIVARQVGNLVRGASRWLTRSAGILEQDIGEYLQEEARSLPPRLEVQDWMDEVDAARSDVDRLDARIQRLAVQLDPQRKAGEAA
ncbi:MAG: SCP2 sterol-binding domain-containing protein [Gammaproteobacteria bacterium]|nr:SCP2 sterol-binding domain-containing protein [Gammaproteobacteria bacterium]